MERPQKAAGSSAKGTSSPANPDASQAMGYSIRSDQYRSTEWRAWNSGPVLGRELYDHFIDAEESKNLAGTPSRAAAQATLAKPLAHQFPPRALRLP